MQAEKQSRRIGAARTQQITPLPRRILDGVRQVWRPTATVVAVILALLLTAHVITGAHGLQVWKQKRAEDLQLRQEIQQIQDENAHLRTRIDHLKNDPEAIEHEVREKLHYARPGEVIYSVPASAQNAQPASGK